MGVIHLKVRISADSTCDLTKELTDKYDISIAPLYIVKDGKDYKDGLEISPEDIYTHTEKTGQLCSTAAVSISDYTELFSRLLRDCDGVVHINISSQMSACHQNARLAAGELENVYVVDSRNLSTGIGHLAVDGAIMAQKGMEAKAIAAELEALREKVSSSFIVDTLAYLRKGGRCSAVAALGANLLSLKPCIEVKDSAMGVGKKYRGSMEKCLMAYVRDRLSGAEDIDTRRIFITDSGRMAPGIREKVKEEVLKHQAFREVIFTRAGGTVCCHCGPGTLGILYYKK